MRIVHFPGGDSGSPDSAEWHAWRAAGIGASDAATIAFNGGLLLPKDAADWQRDYAGLVAEKRNEKVVDKAVNNFAARRGKVMESTVQALICERTGIPFASAFGEMDEHPFIRASFDGITFDLDCTSEVKVASKAVHELALKGEVIPYYRPQLAHQAFTAWGPPEGWSNDRCSFFSNYNDTFSEKLAIVEIPSGTEWLKRMAEALLPLHQAFWKEVKEGRELPAELLEKIALFRRLDAQADEIEKQLKPLKEQITAFAKGTGSPKIDFGGVMAIRSDRRGTVDLDEAIKAMKLDPSAFEAFRKPPTSSWTIKVT
jgi:putative phage-type endonuclease